MRFSGIGLGLGLWAVVGFVAVACGGSNGSEFNDGGPDTSVDPDGDSGQCDGFGCIIIDPNDGGDAGDDDDGGHCVTGGGHGQLKPVNLVVMLDRSGSMGDPKDDTYTGPADPAQRWNPVTLAIENFFNDSESAGMSAALTFFPNAKNSCTVSDYNNANVSLTALPNNAFKPVIDANLPKMADTPTLAAVKGAIQQAQTINTDHKDGKAVIILVTDGEPYCCTWFPGKIKNDVSTPADWAPGCTDGVDPNQGYTDVNANGNLTASANAIAAVKATIPTYVIGVGPSVENLAQLANAGGNALIQVDVAADPAVTSAALLKALQEIRGNVVSCDFDIPPAPSGYTVDFDSSKVHVRYTPNGQATQELVYSEDCSNPNGWQYDNPKAPTKVKLCSDACNAVRTTGGAKVDVGFDCLSGPPA